jgi:hypothetical protein
MELNVTRSAEDAVLMLSKSFPSVDFEVLRFESLSLGEAIKRVSKLDVLVGVHGAGLSHAMFLKSPASILVQIKLLKQPLHFSQMYAALCLKSGACRMAPELLVVEGVWKNPMSVTVSFNSLEKSCEGALRASLI